MLGATLPPEDLPCFGVLLGVRLDFEPLGVLGPPLERLEGTPPEDLDLRCMK